MVVCVGVVFVILFRVMWVGIEVCFFVLLVVVVVWLIVLFVVVVWCNI